jgi:hypothetical protein
LLAFALASPAAAQLAAPNMKGVLDDIDRRCPGLVRQDHAFTDAAATVLNRMDGRWGRNGKRGNRNDPSHDALFFKAEGISPFGGAVIDIIGGAGGPNPSTAWIDQTAETVRLGTSGVFVEPSGNLPPCLSGNTGGGGGDPPPPPPPPPPGGDLSAVVAQLEAINARLARLEARTPQSVDLDPLYGYVDDMIGAGPGEGSSNHVTDIKERQDAALAEITRLFAWLRGRRALSF